MRKEKAQMAANDHWELESLAYECAKYILETPQGELTKEKLVELISEYGEAEFDRGRIARSID